MLQYLFRILNAHVNLLKEYKTWKMENQSESDQKTILESAKNILIKNINSDQVIHHLRTKNVLSREEEDRLLQITSNSLRARRLIDHIMEYKIQYYQQFRTALIKAGQTNLLKYLKGNKTEEDEELVFKDDVDITNSYDGRCMVHLEGDCYVVAKKYKNEMYISSIWERTNLRGSNGEQPEVTSVTCPVRKYAMRMPNRKLCHIYPSGAF